MQTPSQPAPDRPRIVIVAFALYLVAIAGMLAQIAVAPTYMS